MKGYKNQSDWIENFAILYDIYINTVYIDTMYS